MNLGWVLLDLFSLYVLYFMNPLFKKPKDVRFVDMAIWIDNNIHNPDCDMNKAFTYMYLLAYMLGSKAKYFRNIEDYDGFACYLAYSTFMRLTDNTKPPVKSVLNYMKSIMYFRKMGYEQEVYSEMIDPIYNKNWDSDTYREQGITILESSNREIIKQSVDDIFKCLPSIIKENIPKVYSSNKVLYSNLYISVLLSLTSKFTLPEQNRLYLENKLKEKVAFNEVNYYRKHLTDELILWHVPDSMSGVVQVIINKVNFELINIIKELSNEIHVTEDEFNIIAKSAWGDSNHDNENN